MREVRLSWVCTMEEKDTAGVRPVADRGEGWQTRQQRKRSLAGPNEKNERYEEEDTQRRAPLPFGKIDVVA